MTQRDPVDDLHPYYKRKAEKNAETVDFVVTHWKGLLAAVFIAAFLAEVIG